MDIHDALLLDRGDEGRVEIAYLRVRLFLTNDKRVQVIWLDCLLILIDACKEAVKCLLIFVALAQIILKLIVDLIAIIDKLDIV